MVRLVYKTYKRHITSYFNAKVGKGGISRYTKSYCQDKTYT